MTDNEFREQLKEFTQLIDELLKDESEPEEEKEEELPFEAIKDVTFGTALNFLLAHPDSFMYRQSNCLKFIYKTEDHMKIPTLYYTQVRDGTVTHRGVYIPSMEDLLAEDFVATEEYPKK